MKSTFSVAMWRAIFVRLAWVMPTLAWAGPDFGMPVACDYGRDCFVQNHVDVLPAKGEYADYRCGKLSYDGHDGTDFRIADLAKWRAGVPVLAIADGVVRGARDGEQDISVKQGGTAAIAGRGCGNGMAIVHADGYESDYCHLRQGSVRVKPGDRVQKGQVLGLVGLSGLTEFPHLHLTVRQGHRQVDPFTGVPMGQGGCNVTAAPLWSAEVAARLRYIPSALLQAWFSNAAPDILRVPEGAYADVLGLPATSPALVFGVDLIGGQKGDVLHLEILRPDGRQLVQLDQTLDRPQAQFSHFVGKRLTAPAWPVGRYVGRVTLTRGAEVVASGQRTLVVE